MASKLDDIRVKNEPACEDMFNERKSLKHNDSIKSRRDVKAVKKEPICEEKRSNIETRDIVKRRTVNSIKREPSEAISTNVLKTTEKQPSVEVEVEQEENKIK